MKHLPISEPIDLNQAYETFTEFWSPRIVAGVDNYDVKIAKVEGQYVWHAHETDEFFLVLAGKFTVELEGRDPVVLEPMQLFTVPRGMKHRPSGVPGTRIMFLEIQGTLQSIYQKIHDDPSQAIAASLSGASTEESVKSWTASKCTN